MNKSALLPKIVDELFGIMRHPRGALGHMEDCERASGYTVVPVGAVTPFAVPEADWDATCISLDGKTARLVLLHARKPGSGALHRLVSAVQAAGYVPAIIEPIGPDMPAIMRKWKWKRRRKGNGFDSYTEYRPPRHGTLMERG